MRANLTLLAAIMMVHMVQAFPRPDLAVREDENDLSNQSHIFHHLDRNQRTANRNRERERMHRNDAEGPGLKKVLGRPQQAGMARERRFIESPDYSEGGGSAGGGSNSSSSASNTMPTQQPANAAK